MSTHKRPGARGGKREDIGIYVRSSWEANYARFLNWRKQRGEILCWEYEPDEFEFPVKKGSKFYTPDFKVWTSETKYEYHEVKGYMDATSKTKLKRFAKYYPNEHLVLIDASYYRNMSKLLAGIIPNWETYKRR